MSSHTPASRTRAVLDAALRDARYALRLLRRSPAFTLAAVATLTLAIAVNTAVFSIVDAVLLRPLPYPEPDRLALLTRVVRADGVEDTGTAHDGRTWEAIRDASISVDRAVFSMWATGVNMVAGPADARAARYVQQQRIGARFFEVLGIRPLIGREFTSAEDLPGGPAVVILSEGLWRRDFGADPAIVGRTIALRGETATVVGIVPTSVQTGRRADVWTPLRANRQGEGGGANYTILLRLPPSTSWPQAAAELAVVGNGLPRDHRPNVEVSLSLESLQEGLTRQLRQPLLLLWAAVGVVLLVACVNLAGLLLTRAAGRSREIATRLALGSSRAAVVRQLVVESLVLAGLACVLGILLGHAALEALKALADDAFEIPQPVSLDLRAVAAAAILSVAATLMFGVAPAVQASRLDVQRGLSDSGTRGVAGARRRWPRRALVAGQVALGTVLLVVAGLLLRTFTHLQQLTPGFEGNDVITASVSLQDARYATSARVQALFDDALAGMRRIPGVVSAGVSLGLPYERLLNLGFAYVDGAGGRRPGGITNLTYVAGDLFGTLRVPVRRGRVFDERDSTAAPGVVILNDAFVRTYFADADPLERRISIAGRERTIVGIVGDVQVRPGWGNEGPLAAMPLAYVPVSQSSDAMLRLVHGWFSPAFVVRGVGGAEIAAGLRRALDAVDPLLPFAQVRSMPDVQAASIAQPRFLMALLLGLAGAALVLAAVGIHGLIAQSVAERTREIGVRLALGATAGRAIRAVALPGIVLAAAGTLIGSAAAVAAARLLRHFVWGVSATDPLTFAGVAAIFVLVAAAASLAPALRILRLDPATTLRSE